MSSPTEKLEYLGKQLWPTWARDLAAHRCLFLPGIMGSQLFDFAGNDTVWVDLSVPRDVRRLGFERLTPLGGIDSDNQMVLADRTVRPPIIEPPYAQFKRRVPSARYAFDWRESMPVAADWLRRFLCSALPASASRSDGISIITHSMGGCLLLALLASTREFDDRITQIVFVAPPFHGALRPLRVVEYGQGSPVDALVRNRDLRRVAATMPGLFQLALAPRTKWPTSLPGLDRAIVYPVRGKGNVHDPSFWSDPRHPMREAVLRYASDYHELTAATWPEIHTRFENRLSVIVGINGRNTLSRVSGSPGRWRFHKNPAAPAGQFANGDGTVLLQSSMLPGFDTERVWAYRSAERKNIHSDMMDLPEVINAIAAIRDGKKPALMRYDDFIGSIDFSRETSTELEPWADLDFEERARLRSAMPPSEWTAAGLRAEGDDVELFHSTHAAALRVLDDGSNLGDEATRLGVNSDHLVEYIRRGLMAF